jgi:hypothetical protein
VAGAAQRGDHVARQGLLLHLHILIRGVKASR